MKMNDKTVFLFRDRLRKFIIGSAVDPIVGVACVHRV